MLQEEQKNLAREQVHRDLKQEMRQLKADDAGDEKMNADVQNLPLDKVDLLVGKIASLESIVREFKLKKIQQNSAQQVLKRNASVENELLRRKIEELHGSLEELGQNEHDLRSRLDKAETVIEEIRQGVGLYKKETNPKVRVLGEKFSFLTQQDEMHFKNINMLFNHVMGLNKAVFGNRMDSSSLATNTFVAH